MFTEISIDELAVVLDGSAHLVDVRETDEYVEGHVAGAVLAPLSVLPDMVHLFRADTTNYVICKSGGRSARACEWLAGQGYDVVNIAGGTMAWVNSGRAVVTGDQPA
jgi:rhodanese-related sulfurtransferase